jgi:hypothetical protein
MSGVDGSILWRAALIKGVAIAINAFAASCGWIAARGEAIGWT